MKFLLIFFLFTSVNAVASSSSTLVELSKIKVEPSTYYSSAQLLDNGLGYLKNCSLNTVRGYAPCAYEGKNFFKIAPAIGGRSQDPSYSIDGLEFFTSQYFLQGDSLHIYHGDLAISDQFTGPHFGTKNGRVNFQETAKILSVLDYNHQWLSIYDSVSRQGRTHSLAGIPQTKSPKFLAYGLSKDGSTITIVLEFKDNGFRRHYYHGSISLAGPVTMKRIYSDYAYPSRNPSPWMSYIFGGEQADGKIFIIKEGGLNYWDRRILVLEPDNAGTKIEKFNIKFPTNHMHSNGIVFSDNSHSAALATNKGLILVDFKNRSAKFVNNNVISLIRTVGPNEFSYLQEIENQYDDEIVTAQFAP